MMWLVTVRFPSSPRSVRRFLVHGETQAAAEQAFAAADAEATRAGRVPFVGPQNRVEWMALEPYNGVVELPEMRYR